MKPEPMPCRSCCRIISGEEIVVLISTTAFPSWSATLITADSSVRLFVIGASTVLPDGVTLMKRGATRIVAAGGPAADKGHVRPSKRLERRAEELPADAASAEGFVDIDLGHLALEARAGIEEHAPAQPDDPVPRPRRQDDVLAGEAGGRGI